MLPMTLPWLIWIAVAFLSFMVMEVYGHLHYGEPGTLSGQIRAWSNFHPLVPFMLGCVVGALAFHFWQKPAAALLAKLMHDGTQTLHPQ